MNKVVSTLLTGVSCIVLAHLNRVQADYASTVTGLNPVAYYRFNTTNAVPLEHAAVNQGSLGSAVDGEYQTMALSRGLPGAIAGDPNTAAATGGASRIVVPHNAAYNPEGAFTLEAWLNPGNDAAVLTAALNAAHMADPRSGWILYQNGTEGWSFRMFNQSGTASALELAGGGPVAINTWHHVVITYNGTTATLFVNGAEAATGEPVGSPKAYVANTDGPFVIGGRSDFAATYAWKGAADEVAIYATALSASAVAEHYQNAKNAARTQPYSALILSGNPALYLRLDEPALQLPVALNSGSWGAAANGVFLPGTSTAVPALQKAASPGFESTNIAAGFDGISGIVQTPAWNLNTDTATMMAWVKRDGLQQARAGILHQRSANSLATGMAFSDDGRSLSYCWEDKAETYNFNPGFVVPDQTWTFVAVTVSPETSVLYMGTANGLQAATNSYYNYPHDFSGTTVEIGSDNLNDTRLLRGAIDEFAIFDKTLAYEEVDRIFKAALPAVLGVTRTPAQDPVYEGLAVTFQAAVNGAAPSYQWLKDGAVIPGATSAALNLTDVTTASSGEYAVTATTGGQTLTSLAQVLNVVHSEPIITQAPASAVRMINGAAQFSATIQGSHPFTYQWKKDAAVLPGATAPTLLLTDLQSSDAGDYTLVVTNPYGSAEASASLTLLTPSKLASAVTDLGPVGYWRLDETTGATASDYWGGRDGTYNTGSTLGATGPRPSAFGGFDAANTAVQLDGSSGKVVIPSLNLNAASLTIAGWIYPDGVQADYAGVIFSRGSSVSGLDFKGTTEQIGYHWNDTSETHQWDSGLYPVQSQWNFIALVVEPTQGTMYLDAGTGLQISVNTVAHGAANLDGTFQLGQDGTASRLFKGMIDEVVIYDRALSTAEITALRGVAFTGNVSPAAARFVTQPKSQSIMAGSILNLSAKVTGSVPLSYQWQKNGVDIPGAVRSSLNLGAAAVSNTGTYRLVVTQGTTPLTSSEAIVTVNPVPTHLNIPADLVLHLKFDGNYQDASGRNNNGTAQGAPQIVAGKIGSGALRVNTVVTDGYVAEANFVTLGSPADLQLGGSANFSVAFWTKFSGVLGDLPFLCNNINSYGGPGFVFAPSYETGSWSWSLNDGVGEKAWPGVAAQYGNDAGYADTLNDGQWHHLTFVVDRASDVTTYVDGEKVHAKSIAGLEFNPDTGLPINIGQGANSDYAVGGVFEMDDLGVWRRALSEFEAQAIYVVGNGYGRSFDTEGPATVTLGCERTAAGIVLTWSAGILESADNINGAWTPVPGVSAPTCTVNPTEIHKFYRVKVQ